ncbi:hypothetical protein JCM3770_000380 [Rhodotorula araucariae]
MPADMKPQVALTLIVAATPSNAIGRNSTLPWRLSKEMGYFARVTKGEQPGRNAVIMGRKSWEGIPSRFRPLPERENVVVSRQEGFDLGGAPRTHLASSLSSAISLLRSSPTASSGQSSASCDRVFLIGGAQLYNAALQDAASLRASTAPYTVDRILLTRLFTEYPDCDTHLHDFVADVDGAGGKIWRRTSHEELNDWAGWDVPEGVQREQDKLVKGEERIVEYEYQMWVR